MRVRHVTDEAIFWSLGRGEGDEVLGVEVRIEGSGNLSRRIISRGKYGKERILFVEKYSPEEYKGIIRSECALISSAEMEGNDEAATLIIKAIELLRRACERL